MTVPLTGAGSSTSTLSVEISTIVSSRAMKSPIWACHSRIVPSVTDSPAPGVTMSTVSPVPAGAEVPAGAGASAAGAGEPLVAPPAGWGPAPRRPFVTPFSDALDAGVGWPLPSVVAGAPPLVLISASTSPTLTVSPSAKKSLTIVPLTLAGTSASTLSVEISTSVSSAVTESPSCLCHSRIVPSVTDSPIAGIVT